MQQRTGLNLSRSTSRSAKRRTRLSCERLEDRQLLAGDAFHFDVNQDGEVTPMDALNVINEVARNGNRLVEGAVDEAMDVNRDEFISAFDALVVANQIARQSSTGETNAEILELTFFGPNAEAGATLVNNAEDLREILVDPPEVDFSLDTVVAFHRGTFPTSGYTIDFVSATSDSGAATVTLQLGSPPEDVYTLQVITNPRIVLKLEGVIDQITFVDTDGNVLDSDTV
ncbi:MAG: dockerin type I domain-containing protein [Planctomycetota bacterium]